MKVHGNKMLAELNEEFSKKYPALKLKFYSKVHQDHEGSPSNLSINENQTVANAFPNYKEGKIDISSSQTVYTLESTMEKELNIYVQVFRRSNDKWLQTITTDDWTLEIQNEKGLFSQNK